MQSPHNRSEIIAIVVILLLAGWLRFGYTGVNSFAFDEARLSLISLRMARSGEFATVGMPSSAGVPNMPAAAWIFALPYAVSPNPQIATWFVSLLSWLAVVGIWRVARQWGVRAGLVAALFLTMNPFAVLYSRSIWAQNLLIPFAALWMWMVFTAANSERPNQQRIAIGCAVFLTGFVGQVHFAGVALVLAGGYSFLRWRWWRYPLAVVIGTLGAVVCALPFLLTPGTLSGVLDATGGASQINLSAWQQSVQLTLGTGWSYLLHGDVELPLVRATSRVVTIGFGALIVVFVGLMGVFGAAALLGVDGETQIEPETHPSFAKHSEAPTHLLEIALVVLVIFPLFFTRHSTPVFIHYLLPVLPAIALILGWLSQDRHSAILRNTVSVLVVVASLGWFGQLIRAFPAAAQAATPNGMATPLNTLQTAANTIDDKLPVLYFTHGDAPNTQGEPAIFQALWWQQRDNTRIIDGRNLLILPPYPATIAFTERPFQAWEEMRQSDLFVDLHEVPRREGVEPWQITAYDGETPPAGFDMLDEPVRFAHGGVLLGWRAYTIGGRVRASTLWRAPGAIGEQVQQFHHLRTEETPTGEPFTGADVSVRGHTWREGDLVIVMGDFMNLPADQDYVLEVGHYILPDIARIPHQTGDIVWLGAFRISELPPPLE